MKKIILSAIVAGAVIFGGMFSADAASREEIAAINVKTGADFKYWTDNSPVKAKIIKFVEDAKNKNSANYIPEDDRIAMFDMDGTFYCETAPYYFQETMFLYRALEDKSFKPDQKMVDFAKQIQPKIMNKKGLSAEERKTLLDYLTSAYAGLTPEEYRAIVRKFMQTNEQGFTNLKRSEAFYLPMVEVISYLTNNGFAVYINTACGNDTTRVLVGDILPVKSDRIIASDFVYTSTRMGKDAPTAHFYDRFNEKIVISGKPVYENAQVRKIFSILNNIGKKPVLAFGNSMGDSGMIEYTLQDNKYKSEAFYVLCDDTEREFGNLKRVEGEKKIAKERGWNTISMRNDFKTIYGYNVKKN